MMKMMMLLFHHALIPAPRSYDEIPKRRTRLFSLNLFLQCHATLSSEAWPTSEYEPIITSKLLSGP